VGVGGTLLSHLCGPWGREWEVSRKHAGLPRSSNFSGFGTSTCKTLEFYVSSIDKYHIRNENRNIFKL
jgi:hypothetical protein